MDEAIEYYDFLMTAELSMMIARKYGEYENTAIKKCCASLVKRAENKRVKLIFKGLMKSQFPVGALSMLRRQFDEAVSQ